MKLLNWFKSVFSLNQFKLQECHEIEFCFESGGIKSYKFVNEFKIPYMRAMAAMDIYAELEQMSDSKYLKIAFEGIIEALKQGNNIGAGIIASNSLERMNHISNIDLMYKLASVLYIDEGENPYHYDYEYADKKIKRWQKEKDIEGFFLRTPLSELIPSFDGLAMSMTQYGISQRKELLQTLKRHLSILSEKSKNSEQISTLKSQIKELEELLMSS